MPYLKLAAVHDDKAGTLTLFALNRSLDEEMPLAAAARRASRKLACEQALQLRDADLKAINTRADPDRIAPKPLAGVRVDGERVEATLAPASWNMIELATAYALLSLDADTTRPHPEEARRAVSNARGKPRVGGLTPPVLPSLRRHAARGSSG